MTSVQRTSKFSTNNLQFGFFNDNYLNDSNDSIRNMTAEVYNSNSRKKLKKRMQKAQCNGQNDCNHCVDEREIRHVELEENQLLWSELREHILYMYKIGRDQNLGPTLVDRVKYLVDTLCSKDIHQLFIRVEILACDVIKDCLESVERIFVNEFRNTTVAFNYLESIITDCDNYLFAARKMLPMLKNLESHIKKFNMCWVLLHQNLFRIYYLEDSRCKIRAKKAKLMLLSDMEVPAFTETILKFSQFTEAVNVLADQWNDSVIKIKKYRESRPVYLNCQHFLYDTWQDFNVNNKKNKHPIEKLNLVNHETTQSDLKTNKKIMTNITQQNVPLSSSDNYSVLTKSQAKKVRRKSRADHSRQPSADLMPPPPPRVFDTNISNSIRLENDYDNQIVTVPREKTRKKVETSPHTPLKKMSNSQTQEHKYVGDRDVDELVAFIEGFSISDKNIDVEESENKKRRKKQKKEKQRLKKMQSMLQDDQVAQLIKRSPGVTITMVRPNNETCTKSNSVIRTPPETISKPSPAVRVPQVPQNHPVKEPPVTANNNSNPGSRMVTIRRINEANTDEPTVTITLKGPTPDQDQVLYRIINGQADYGLLADSVLNKKTEVKKEENKVLSTPPVAPLSKKQKKKNRRKQNQNELTIEAISPEFSPNNDYLNYYNSQSAFKLPDESVQITKSVLLSENETDLDTTKKSKRKKDKANQNKSTNTSLQFTNSVNSVTNQQTSKTIKNRKESIDSNYYGENTIVVINSTAKNNVKNSGLHQTKSNKIDSHEYSNSKMSHKSADNIKQVKTQKNEFSKQIKITQNTKIEITSNKSRQNQKQSQNSSSDEQNITQRKNDNAKTVKNQKQDENKTKLQKSQKLNDSKVKLSRNDDSKTSKSQKLDDSKIKLQKCDESKSKSQKNDDCKPKSLDTRTKSSKLDDSRVKCQKIDDSNKLKQPKINDPKSKTQKIEDSKAKSQKLNDSNKNKSVKVDDCKSKQCKSDELKVKQQKNESKIKVSKNSEMNSPKQTKTTLSVPNSTKNQQKVKECKTYNNSNNNSNNNSENRRTFNTQQLKHNKDDSICSKNHISNQLSQKPTSELFIEPPLNSYKLIPENLRLPAGITITKVPSNAPKKTLNDPKRSKYVRNTNYHSDLCTNQVNFATDSVPPKNTNDLPIDLVIEKQQQLVVEQDFEVKPENRQPPIGTGVPRTYDAPAKFIRAPDGRIIIRSPMARSTTPPLNPITMIRQDLEMGVAPPNVPVSPFWSRNDWWLPGTDNVFAPKDIDLEDNTLDAEERELEAFKRFCQEPVPPQRQEVTHLNVQKIIIKKNQHS